MLTEDGPARLDLAARAAEGHRLRGRPSIGAAAFRAVAGSLRIWTASTNEGGTRTQDTSRACWNANRQKTGHQMTSLNTQIQPKLQGSAPVDAL